MTPIQFSHANGFNASTYRHFFDCLSPYSVQVVEQFGHGEYAVAPRWQPLAQELIDNIERHGKHPVIGIGHSLGGGVTLLAAEQRPDLFQHIILLDPPIFAPIKRRILELLKLINQFDKQTPAARTRVRRQFFDTKEEAYDYFKPKKLFQTFHPKSFENYIEYGLKPHEKKGYQLAFSREIEYQIFRQLPIIRQKIPLKMPCHFMYSGHYKVLWKTDIRWLKNRLLGAEFVSFDGGHLFPLEQPEKTAEVIKSLLQK